jgi:hypothetical protein
MNNREMIALLKEGSTVLVPVLTRTDVVRLKVVKGDLIAELKHIGLDKECPWEIIDKYQGTITLDVAN